MQHMVHVLHVHVHVKCTLEFCINLVIMQVSIKLYDIVLKCCNFISYQHTCRFAIEVHFRAVQSSGLLFYLGNGVDNFFALYLEDHHLKVSLQTTDSNEKLVLTKSLISKFTYDDGRWHIVSWQSFHCLLSFIFCGTLPMLLELFLTDIQHFRRMVV